MDAFVRPRLIFGWRSGSPRPNPPALLNLFPNNLPTSNGGIIFLYVAKDQATVLKRVRTNLARADVARIGSHFRQVNDLLLLHIDLVASTIREHAIGGSKLFFFGRMRGVSPFRQVWIHQVGARITVALVHEETLAVRQNSGLGECCRLS